VVVKGSSVCLAFPIASVPHLHPVQRLESHASKGNAQLGAVLEVVGQGNGKLSLHNAVFCCQRPPALSKKGRSLLRSLQNDLEGGRTKKGVIRKWNQLKREEDEEKKSTW
jgi:hypothetical protein